MRVVPNLKHIIWSLPIISPSGRTGIVVMNGTRTAVRFFVGFTSGYSGKIPQSTIAQIENMTNDQGIDLLLERTRFWIF